MQVLWNKVKTEEHQDHWRFICSDLHDGSPSFDVERWLEDMEAAKRVNARIWINGDVFDAIDTRDKRYTPDCLIPELHGKRDIIGAIVQRMRAHLRPYAHLIDMLGAGNHEMKWVKWNATDPTQQLIDWLNEDLEREGNTHRIAHGGVSGYIRTTFQFGSDASASCSHDTWYHHGSGGDSPVTKGAIDFSRLEARWDADVYTMGHKHHRTATVGARGRLTTRSGTIERREHLLIQTGSYFLNHRQTKDEPLAFSYAEEFNHAPKPMGGWFLRIRPHRIRKGGTTHNTFKQAVMSEP